MSKQSMSPQTGVVLDVLRELYLALKECNPRELGSSRNYALTCYFEGTDKYHLGNYDRAEQRIVDALAAARTVLTESSQLGTGLVK